ncbi:MAG: transporter substrate-binding domain-containing protein [Lachnospiraceae bacterium]|nr:transporter substrate-binding domain-containing protein [Lachnospiraceae bacterium]
MRLLKKVTALSLTMILLLTMTGCGKKDDLDTLGKIKKNGKITIGVESNQEPWCYHAENGELTGFDVELAQAVAEKLGVGVLLFECNWDDLFRGFDQGKYDIIIDSLEKTEEREKKYDFSDPYGQYNMVLVVAEDNTDIKGFEDLKGKKTSNAKGTTYANIASKYGAEVHDSSGVSDAIGMVASGLTDAMINTELPIYDYMKRHPEAALKIVATSDDPAVFMIPVRNGGESATLLAEVNRALSELKEEGTLSEMSNKYLGIDITDEK